MITLPGNLLEKPVELLESGVVFNTSCFQCHPKTGHFWRIYSSDQPRKWLWKGFVRSFDICSSPELCAKSTHRRRKRRESIGYEHHRQLDFPEEDDTEERHPFRDLSVVCGLLILDLTK